MNIDFSSTLVVMPARANSKRIPDKNIRNILGMPMLYWPLMTVSKLFPAENVLISTDSKKVKELAEDKGLTVPFMRPSNLSDDYTSTWSVVAHALAWYEKHVKKVEYVMTVYPTAVLLNEEDIILAMENLCGDQETDSIMSATTFPFPIQRAIFKNKNGFVEMFEPQNYDKRSQDFVEAFHDAGQFYLTRSDAVSKGATLTNSRVKIHLLNRKNVIDIDTMEDFFIAEEKLSNHFKATDHIFWNFYEKI